ncbi:cytochrome c [Beijerinckia sp. L45]|uniref:c-type cytochrome n=1 Tax=Beijerinckia sp. L45 TaxID=1641855 RepID=UPI001FF05037|nr:cytochrome c [Beijerinckia sp. L45]
MLIACVALAGCDQANMVSQGKSQTWDKDTFLPQDAAMQTPVPGSVPRDQPNQPVGQPTSMTPALLARGHERYDIFCTPCHGLAGQGDGMIVQRGFPKPPAFTDDRLMRAKAQYFYDVISTGRGTMYSYAEQVPPADLWAIAAYIRALQVSQRPTFADLPTEDQAKLMDPAK